MANLMYDQALSFGKIDSFSSASAGFPDIINLGRADGESGHYPGKEFTGAGRLTVDVCCESVQAAQMVVTVQGSADGASGWTDVGKNTFNTAQMKAGPCQTAVSPSGFKFLRVALSVGGASGGSAQAFLNTYAGK